MNSSHHHSRDHNAGRGSRGGFRVSRGGHVHGNRVKPMYVLEEDVMNSANSSSSALPSSSSLNAMEPNTAMDHQESAVVQNAGKHKPRKTKNSEQLSQLQNSSSMNSSSSSLMSQIETNNPNQTTVSNPEDAIRELNSILRASQENISELKRNIVVLENEKKHLDDIIVSQKQLLSNFETAYNTTKSKLECLTPLISRTSPRNAPVIAATSTNAVTTTSIASVVPTVVASAVQSSEQGAVVPLDNQSEKKKKQTKEELQKLNTDLEQLLSAKKFAEVILLLDEQIPLLKISEQNVVLMIKSLLYPREIPNLVTDRLLKTAFEFEKKQGNTKDVLPVFIELIIFLGRTFNSRSFEQCMRIIKSIYQNLELKMIRGISPQNASYVTLLKTQTVFSTLLIANPADAKKLETFYFPFRDSIVLQDKKRSAIVQNYSMNAKLAKSSTLTEGTSQNGITEDDEEQSQGTSAAAPSSESVPQIAEPLLAKENDSIPKASTTQPQEIVFNAEHLTTETLLLDCRALTQEAIVLYEEIKPSQEEENGKNALLQEIKQVAKMTIENSEAYMFGSSANGFGAAGSDVDFCIKINSTDENVANEPKLQAKKLKQFKQGLEMPQYKHITVLEDVFGSRVPVLKMQDTRRGLKCDICIDNFLAVVNTRLLKLYSMIDDRVAPLVFVIKYWAKKRHINEAPAGTLSSYTFVIMVIFFLQNLEHPILPSLQQMISDKAVQPQDISSPAYVNAHDCRYFANPIKLKELWTKNTENKMSVGELVVNFFRYYVEHFRLNEWAISIRTGKPIAKKSNYALSVEDPFELRDLGAAVSEENVPVIMEEFKRAHSMLMQGASISDLAQEREVSQGEQNIYKKKEDYEDYLTKEQALALIEKGELLRGSVRVNKKKYTEAFVVVDGMDDIFIDGFKARNRALHGDIVAVKLLDKDSQENSTSAEESESSDESTSRKYHGQIVCILEKKSPKIFAGRLMEQEDEGKYFRWLLPIEKAYPKIMLDEGEFKDEFGCMSRSLDDLIIVCEMNNWKTQNHYPKGRILGTIGLKKDFFAQKKALLLQHTPNLYENVFLKKPTKGNKEVMVPHKAENIVNEIDINEADLTSGEFEDLRQRRVFTIDPKTSRDLDDALSIEPYNENESTITVYVADVCKFIKEGDAMDMEARKRATSVYMIDSVEHMLDPFFSQNVCSILPGVSRYSLAVEFRMTKNADIVPGSVRFVRCIIKSCCKLDYDTVQTVLEGKPVTELPAIHNGFTWDQIVADFKEYNRLAIILRERRENNGALSLANQELYFEMDENGYPAKCVKTVHNESHKLIEEFMLVANRLAAESLYNHYKEDAFVRNHTPPDEESWYPTLTKLVQDLNISKEQVDIQALVANGAKDQELVHQIFKRVETNPVLLKTLQNNINKELNLAKYVRVGDFEDIRDVHHYALNVPFYTHFTSPIRRYADVIVHRQLLAMIAATRQGKQLGELSDDMKGPKLSQLAKHLNDQSYAAKILEEQCQKQYLAFYLMPKLAVCVQREPAVVVSLGRRSLTVFIPQYGIELQVNVMKDFKCVPDSIKEVEAQTTKSKNVVIESLSLHWDKPEKNIDLTVFKPVLVDLDVDYDNIPYEITVYNIYHENEELKTPIISQRGKKAIEAQVTESFQKEKALFEQQLKQQRQKAIQKREEKAQKENMEQQSNTASPQKQKTPKNNKGTKQAVKYVENA